MVYRFSSPKQFASFDDDNGWLSQRSVRHRRQPRRSRFKAKTTRREETVRALVKSSYFAIAAVTGVLMAAGHARADDKKNVVGVSNTLIGNGWAEEMVCSIKAEALAAGKGSKVVVGHRNG